jgi:hypothetical protein
MIFHDFEIFLLHHRKHLLKAKKGTKLSGGQDNPQIVLYTNGDGPELWV